MKYGREFFGIILGFQKKQKSKTKMLSANYKKGAVNAVNKLFYSSVEGDVYDTGLAKIYIDSSAVFAAFGDFLIGRAESEKLRVKQLSAGTKALNMWKRIGKMLPEDLEVDLEVTDFEKPVFGPGEMMDLRDKGVNVGADSYNFFDEFEELSEDERFDVMMVTYGFDSVWAENDGFYEKCDGRWMEVKYRVLVNGEKDVRELMQQSLEVGESEVKLCKEWFEGVEIDERRELIDIETVPFGKELDEYYRGMQNVRCSVPGTMITRVEEAFERQLKGDGVFVIGDVVVPDKKVAGNFRRSSVCRSGVGARYKVDDYGFAKWFLEKKGYGVDLVRLDDFVAGYRELDSEFDVKLGERGRDWNYVVMVRG